MKKKLLALFLVVALAVTSVVTGTLAYQTDVESNVNVMTVGQVDIKQDEVFEQEQVIYPGVPVEKVVTVSNVGSLPAYARTVIAVELGEATPDMFTVIMAGDIEAVPVCTTTINGENYALYTYTYDGKLDPGASYTSLECVILSHEATNETVASFGDEHTILVVSQACQTEGVDFAAWTAASEAENALNAVFGEISSANHPWTEFATVSTAEEFVAALENGGNIALVSDIDASAVVGSDGKASSMITIAKGKSAVIDLNGHSISYSAEPTVNGNFATIVAKGDLEIVGNGTISIDTNYDMEWNALCAVISVEGGSLTLGEGVNIINNGGTSMAYGVDVNSTLGKTVLNVDGAIISSPYTAVRLFNNHKTEKAIVNLNSGVVDGDKRDIWVHNPSASAVDENGVVNIAPAYTYEVTVQDTSYNSRIYQLSTDLVSSMDELTEAISVAKTGDTVYMTSGEYTLSLGNVAEGVTIDGNGATIVPAEGSGNAYGGTFGKDTTIKNLTFEGSNATRYTYTSGDVVFEDCVFSGDVYGFHVDGANDGTITFKNCEFIGFNAFASTGTYYFENCTFTHSGSYGHTNMWGIGYFNNCTWNDGASLSPGSGGGTIYMNGVEESYHHEYIGSAANLVAFAKSVNEGGDSWNKQAVLLVDDIDLSGIDWEPIGQTGATQFKGIFDGQGHTIYNLSVDSSSETGANYSSGLFGWIESSGNVTVKNVNVDGATIVGNHNCAVIVGYLYGRVENCHVTDATVICTHANGDACGDKAGVIVGYAGPAADNVVVTGCSAVNCSVSAGRDGGQLIGAGYTASVSDCSATNVSVSATTGCTHSNAGGNLKEELIGRVMA